MLVAILLTVMIVYVVTEVNDKWRVTRHDPSTPRETPLFGMLVDKATALSEAFLRAELDRPSRIMQISRDGRVEIVREFEKLKTETND